jgi:hypothetical protein
MSMRTVVEDGEVTAKIAAESSIYPRMYEAFDALVWWLSRNPETGELVDDYYWLYKQRGNRELNIPALVVLYTFDHRTVEIFALLVRLPDL